MSFEMYQNFPPNSNQGIHSNFSQMISNQGISQTSNTETNSNINQGYNYQGLNVTGLNQNMNQGNNQNMNQGINQNMNQGINQNMNQGLNFVPLSSTNYSQNMNQSLGQAMNQSMNQIINSGLNQSQNSNVQNYSHNLNQYSNNNQFLGYNNQGNTYQNSYSSLFSNYDNSNQRQNVNVNQGYSQGLNLGINSNQGYSHLNQSDNRSLNLNDQIFMTDYLQKVSIRNQNNQFSYNTQNYSQQVQNASQKGQLSSQAQPFVTTQPIGQFGISQNLGQGQKNIWQSNPQSGNESHLVERPKRATFTNTTGSIQVSSNSHQSHHHRSLSAGTVVPNRPIVQSTRNYFPFNTTGSQSSSFSSGIPLTTRVQSSSSLDLLTNTYSTPITTGSLSYSSEDDLIDEPLTNSFSSSISHSSSNSVSNSVKSISSYSSSSSSIFSSKYTSIDLMSQDNYMKVPDELSNSPSINPHVISLEPNIIDHGYGIGGSISSSISHSSNYSQSGNGNWPNSNLGQISLVSLGANLQLINPSNTSDFNPRINNSIQFNISEEETSETLFSNNNVVPRYATTPSSPATKQKQKSHSTPPTPSTSPPKGYSRKPRSLGPSPQRPRQGNSRNYNTWGGNESSNRSTSPKSRQKARPRSKEESQASKQKYKDLSRQLKESSNFREAKELASSSLNDMPIDLKWKICMDLADMAKRENLLDDARYWFKQVNILQPQAAQGWLEYAKLEEECGDTKQCHKLLMKGLQHCQQNESLLIKAVKFYESINRIDSAREILGRLKFMSIEKNWKIFLEGALLESRDGKSQMAREIFKLLMHKVKRHGPIFYEAYKLEERCEEYDRALNIVKRGLDDNQRYGPLWFAYLHLLERDAANKAISNNKSIDLTTVREAVDEAVKTISSELVWKVYFEAAHIEERANEIKRARNMYARAVVSCLKNLRWKVWLAGARTELNAGMNHIARELLNRALKEVPNKTRAQVLIECSRLEEYYGNIDRAREFLRRAKHEAKHEWKVFLESILLEMRANNIRQAILEANEALEIHRGTGRLWAVLIQLNMIDGPKEQMKVFNQALKVVPKSGEVWCEGARIRLNPLSKLFNLDEARRYLNYAIKFTPQYGDSFIEYLRLELLTKGPRLDEDEKIYLEQLCVNADPNYGPLWFFCKLSPTDPTRSVLRRAKTLLRQELIKYQIPYQKAILRFSCKLAPTPLDISSEYKLEHFAMSLQSLTSSDDNESRKKRIFGSEQLSA